MEDWGAVKARLSELEESGFVSAQGQADIRAALERVEELEQTTRKFGVVQEELFRRAEADEAKLALVVEALELGLALAKGELINFKHYGLKSDDDISGRIEAALAAAKGE